MTGMFIAGAYYQIPIVMDGLISSVAALVAVRLNDRIREYILPSHISAEPAGSLICEALALSLYCTRICGWAKARVRSHCSRFWTLRRPCIRRRRHLRISR